MASPTKQTPESRPESSSRSTAKRPLTTCSTSSGRSLKRSKSKSPTPEDDIRAPICATHFGVELEFVLAFKEDLLKSIISKYDFNADIIKTFTDSEHEDLVATVQMDDTPAYDCRRRSPSWALHVPETDIVCNRQQHKGMVFTNSNKGKQWVRRYVMEPLLIAKDRLGDEGLESNVVGWIEPHPNHRDDPKAADITFPTKDGTDENIMLRKSLVDYTKWTLANDHTVIGALRSQLWDHLKDRGILEDDLVNWDSYGVEMISPVFELEKKKNALEEVGRYLGALAGRETSTLGSVWTSAHVHIGFNFNNPEDMPILLLQHLAYILVLHEDLISECHLRSRSGIPLPETTPEEPDAGDASDDEEFDPNAEWKPPPAPTEEGLEQEDEQKVLATEAKYTGAGNVDSNARYLRKKLASHSTRGRNREIRNAIFKNDGTIFDLVDLLQHTNEHGRIHRGYMYNFANLVNLARNETSWKPIKPTVEFRQHACTLDPDMLGHWVTLLEGIVRKSEEMALEPVGEEMSKRTYAEREGGKYTSTRGAPWPYEDMSKFCMRFLRLE